MVDLSTNLSCKTIDRDSTEINTKIKLLSRVLHSSTVFPAKAVYTIYFAENAILFYASCRGFGYHVKEI